MWDPAAGNLLLVRQAPSRTAQGLDWLPPTQRVLRGAGKKQVRQAPLQEHCAAGRQEARAVGLTGWAKPLASPLPSPACQEHPWKQGHQPHCS